MTKTITLLVLILIISISTFAQKPQKSDFIKVGELYSTTPFAHITAEPDQPGKIIGQVEPDTKVKVIGKSEDGRFYKIEYNDVVGWIKKDWIWINIPEIELQNKILGEKSKSAICRMLEKVSDNIIFRHVGWSVQEEKVLLLSMSKEPIWKELLEYLKIEDLTFSELKLFNEKISITITELWNNNMAEFTCYRSIEGFDNGNILAWAILADHEHFLSRILDEELYPKINLNAVFDYSRSGFGKGTVMDWCDWWKENSDVTIISEDYVKKWCPIFKRRGAKKYSELK